MTNYEKIRTRDGRVMILRDPVEVNFLGSPALTGIQVNNQGDEISGQGFDERRQIVSIDVIGWRKPMIMSTYYGELVYMNGKP